MTYGHWRQQCDTRASWHSMLCCFTFCDHCDNEHSMVCASGCTHPCANKREYILHLWWTKLYPAQPHLDKTVKARSMGISAQSLRSEHPRPI